MRKVSCDCFLRDFPLPRDTGSVNTGYPVTRGTMREYIADPIRVLYLKECRIRIFGVWVVCGLGIFIHEGKRVDSCCGASRFRISPLIFFTTIPFRLRISAVLSFPRQRDQNSSSDTFKFKDFMFTPRSLIVHFALVFAAVFISKPLLAETSDGRVTNITPTSLVRDGERWVCLGDSITALNCYPPLLGRVFNHYHPDATLTVINSGQAGDTASADPKKLTERVLKYKPTIVSIMYGMNEAINQWTAERKKESVQEAYRAALTYITRTLREQGITVLLMSPTLTDPSTHAYATLERTPLFLSECAEIVRSVAQSEGAFYVPVQEDFDLFQDNLPKGIALTADGVHPSALGQYRIARSLWDFCGFDKPLSSGTARPSQPAGRPALVPVTATLGARFVKTDATGVAFTFETQSDVTLEVNWSLVKKVAPKKGGDPIYDEMVFRGSATVNLVPGKNHWTLPVSADRLPTNAGQSADILLDLRVADSRQLYVVDLSRTQVLHLKNDRVSGVIESAYERPNGKRLATWEARRIGDSLALDFEVFDKDIVSTSNVWPFLRDGLNLMLDFRPTDRFAAIGVDREVTQLFLNVRDQPFFGVGLRAWTGWGMDFASYTQGEKTDSGYKVRLLIHENFDLKTPVKLSQRDYVGLLVSVAEHASIGGKPSVEITACQKNDTPVSLYANNLMILDLRDKIQGDEIINAHLSSVQAP